MEDVMKPILVVGGTGTLGEPVARALEDAGYRVRLLTRDLAQAEARFADAFEFVQGDVEKPETLEPALSGCYGVHINLAGGPRPGDYERIERQGTANVAAAAAKQGVSRLTYISGASVSEETCWFYAIRAKYQAEEAIRRSGVPYTIFCPSWFMESLPRFVRGEQAVIVGHHPAPFHFVAAQDYARMVAAAYRLPEAVNKRLFIYGPEPLLMQEAVQRYCDLVHPGVRAASVPTQVMTATAAEQGNDLLKDIVMLMAYFEKLGGAAEAGNPQEANRLLGAPTTTLRQWCLETRKETQEGVVVA